MAQKIQLRRGLEANRTGVTPDVGEVLITTDGNRNEIFVGDGTTGGGNEIGYLNKRTGGTVANLTITGDLTVNGTTTTVNSNTVNIGDNIIRLNADLPDNTAPSEDGGFEVYRGTGTGAENAVSFIWNELTNKWQVTEDGITWYDILHDNDLDNTTGGTNGLVAPITSGSVFAALALKQDSLTFGIADTNALQVDETTTATAGELARFTASGIESITPSVAKTTLSLNNVENTALSTWTGSSNISTVGTINTGTWEGDAIADAYISSATTWNSKQDGDADLTAIAALAGTAGLLRKTNTNTWTLDTTSYLSSIAANSITATELNVDGNGSAGNVLTSDGDGSFTWADAGAAVNNATITFQGDQSIVATESFQTNQATPDTINIGHLTTDGHLHVPVTSTTNNGKVLTAGATAGSLSWQTPTTGTVTSIASGDGLTGGPITSSGTLSVQAADSSISVAAGGISVATIDGGTF